MSIQLTKRTEKVGIILAKRGLTTVPPIRVGVALDVSGSTQGLFNNGVIQETFDRLLAVALKFDDNGELDAWTFDNSCDQLQTATSGDEGSFINKHVLQNSRIRKWGGTSYAPVVNKVTQFYFSPPAAPAPVAESTGFLGKLFGKKPVAPEPAPVQEVAKQLPAMLLLVTDGQSDDEHRSAQLLAQAERQYPGMYYQMIGIGNPSYFQYLERKADELDNVGYVNLSSLSVTDDELYEALITTEVTDWIKKQK